MRELFSLEAEYGVIGALIIDQSLVEDVGAVLDRKHFSNEDSGMIYQLCIQLSSKRVKPDLITISEALQTLPSGNDTFQFVADIQRNVVSAANVMTYAGIVVERFQARKLNQIGKDIVNLSLEYGSVATQIARAQELVMAVDFIDDEVDVRQMSEATSELVDDLQALVDGKPLEGVDTGLADVDKIIRKLRPGTLNIIAGRPGSGKSLTANMIAQDAAMTKGGSALVFSLEMSLKELGKRMLANIGTLSLNLLESADVVTENENSTRLFMATSKLKSADIRVCDRPGLSIERICAISRYQHRANPLSVIIVDYIGLVTTEANGRIQNRNQELGMISRTLKGLAKELDIPVVALAQLNRGIEGRGETAPRMSDLRDSGEIEQDADCIIINHKLPGEHGEMGLVMSEVVKCRHAKPGGCVIQMQGEYARFVNAAEGTLERIEGAKQNELEQKKSKASRYS